MARFFADLVSGDYHFQEISGVYPNGDFAYRIFLPQTQQWVLEIADPETTRLMYNFPTGFYSLVHNPGKRNEKTIWYFEVVNDVLYPCSTDYLRLKLPQVDYGKC